VPRLGEQWLALRVLSLEMVSAGWLLQLVAAGIGARVVACEDESCGERAKQLDGFVNELARVLGLSLEGTATAGLARPFGTAGESGGDVGAGTTERVLIELREPQATMQALAVLGALETNRPAWRAEGRGCSLGIATVDAAGCSLCEVCVGVCPTGAFRTDRNFAGSISLSLDPGRCTACEACVGACPESVVTLKRAVDSSVLQGGRRILVAGSDHTCKGCGAPLGVGLSAAALLRMGASHPFLAAGSSRICADCRLRGRFVGSSRPN
jgi:ferredoxin